MSLKSVTVNGSLALLGITLFMVNAKGLTDKDGATKTLSSAGLRVLEVGGKDMWFSAHDTYRTHFKAINQQGDTINGSVNRAVFRSGSEIRFYE